MQEKIGSLIIKEIKSKQILLININYCYIMKKENLTLDQIFALYEELKNEYNIILYSVQLSRACMQVLTLRRKEKRKAYGNHN